jgi:hypothetical protein
MTRLKLDEILRDLSTKYAEINKLMIESGKIMSDASLSSYLDSRDDGFINKLIPKIKDCNGAKGIYTDAEGDRYRVHVVKVRSMTEKDEEILSQQRF